MENEFIGILFELTMLVMKRGGMEETTITVLECPSVQMIKEFNKKYSVPGFRVYVKCEMIRGTAM